ncbi:uncharacterized protein METZ01_LOCUS103589, partial [marine metagenome]
VGAPDYTFEEGPDMMNVIDDPTGNLSIHFTMAWQQEIQNPVIDHQYGYRARVIYKPFIDQDDVIGECNRLKGGLL